MMRSIENNWGCEVRTEKIEYNRKIGFISRGEKPANDKFNRITLNLVSVFDKFIKDRINASGGIDRAEFTDFHPDSDRLLITSGWRYYGLSRKERLLADKVFERSMKAMIEQTDDISFAMIDL